MTMTSGTSVWSSLCSTCARSTGNSSFMAKFTIGRKLLVNVYNIDSIPVADDIQAQVPDD